MRFNAASALAQLLICIEHVDHGANELLILAGDSDVRRTVRVDQTDDVVAVSPGVQPSGFAVVVPQTVNDSVVSKYVKRA